MFQKSHDLAAGDSLDIGAARFERGSQGRFDGAQLRLMEAIACHVGSRRQRGQRQNVGDDLGFEFEGTAARDAGNIEARIGRQAGADTRRFGDAELVICGLQFAVVQQRDLNGSIHSERTPEQGGDGLLGRGNVVVAVLRRNVHIQRRMGHAADGIHALVAGKAGAAAQQRGNQKCDAEAAALTRRARLLPGNADGAQ